MSAATPLAGRTAWTDWYSDGVETAVFVRDQVLVLSTLAGAVVAALEEPRPLADLGAVLVEQFGEPEGDLAEATAAVVADLVESGVLAWFDGTTT